ncbi:uncharacterized protein [Triticum aestivum]|uniref:uncharacterized protein n=1 Tax=Triticum aestivum TaxID=4565 RepID=UPI001D018542|nr:uncharacterized protein LOC123100260 [Triticum aestivum]
MHGAWTRWWSRKFPLNADGVDIHCFIRGLHYFVRIQVWSGRSGKNPGREWRHRRHGRFRRSTRRSSTIASTRSSGTMSKTWSTMMETVPVASKPPKITSIAVVAAKSANTMAAAALSTSTDATKKAQEEGQEIMRHPLTFSFLPL